MSIVIVQEHRFLLAKKSIGRQNVAVVHATNNILVIRQNVLELPLHSLMPAAMSDISIPSNRHWDVLRNSCSSVAEESLEQAQW